MLSDIFSKKATVQRLVNEGYLVSVDGLSYFAYSTYGIITILEGIFEPKKEEPAPIQPETPDGEIPF